MSQTSPLRLCPDTSSGSLLHALARRWRVDSPLRLAAAYLVLVAVTYLPLLLAAGLDSVPLWHAQDPKTLTFLHDWGLGFALVVSFPTLVLLLITDEQVLRTSLNQVQDDGVILLPEPTAASVTEDWTRRFRLWNRLGQRVAIVGGIFLGVVTFWPQVVHPANSWLVPPGGPYLAGYVYLYCITLLYALVIFYVVRCITVSRFLYDLVRRAPLRMLPFHPDNCGGLRPVGRLGLRNQYTLTVLGLNIVLLLWVWWFSLNQAGSLREVMIGASVAYLVLGPVVFMAPLLPFRAGMIHARDEWTREVAQLLRAEFERLRGKIQTGEVTRSDEESIDRLRKVGAVIEELPIWPFDARTLRTFGTAYVVPVGLPLLGKAAQALFASLRV
jgi:hypothetical protein